MRRGHDQGICNLAADPLLVDEALFVTMEACPHDVGQAFFRLW